MYSLTNNSVVLLRGVCPKEPKTYVHTKPCVYTFMAASFITAQTWKPPPRPSAGERGTQRAVQTRDCYSALRRNELWPRRDRQEAETCITAESEQPVWQGYMLQDPNSGAFWERQSYGDSKKVGSCQELGGWEGCLGRAQRIFRAGEQFSTILQ